MALRFCVRRVVLCLRIALTLGIISLTASAASAQPPLDLPLGSSFLAATGGFQLQLNATGGAPPYVYSISPGFGNVPGLRVRTRPYPLPTGFPASTTGGLIGVLNTVGVFNSSIRVTDSLGAVVDKAFQITVNQQHILNNTNPPRPVVGMPYDYELTPFGLIGTALWSAINMPLGLSVNALGHIVGTPTTAGLYTPTITLTDQANNFTRNVNFTIIVNPFDIITSNALPDGTLNAPYSQTIQAPGCGTCVFSTTSGLPLGITLATNGVLSGTPTQTTAGFTINITAAGTNGAATETFFLRINSNTLQPLQITNTPTITSSVGGQFNVGLFAFGGTPPYAITVDSGSLPPGINLDGPGEQVGSTLTPGIPVLTGRATLPGVFNFTVKVTDSLGATGYRAFTWNSSRLSAGYSTLPLAGTTLAAGTPYTQRLLGLGGSGAYTWTPLGLLPGGLSLDAATGIISGTPTDNGPFLVSMQVDDTNNPGTPGSFFVSNLTFNITGPTATSVAINGLGSLLALPPGINFTFNLTASGGTGPYTFTALTALPPGFSLLSGNASTAANGAPQFTGTATQSGTFNFTLKVTDSLGNIGVRSYRMTVTPLTILSTALQTATVGTPYSQRLLAVGGIGTVTWSLDTGSTLLAGLTLGAGGQISGTPTQAGSTSFTIVATDSSGNRATRGLTLIVSSLSISGSDFLPNATSGVAYNHVFTAVGNVAPLVWGATGLPAGMTISPGGTLSGTTFLGPPGGGAAGNFSIFVTATDGVRLVTRRFTLNVNQADPWILSGPPDLVLGDEVVGQPTSIALGSQAGVPPYTFTVAPGSALPPGLQLLTGARVTPTFTPGTTLIAGAPTVAGSYVFDLITTDAVGAQRVQTYRLRVTTIAILSGLRLPRVGEAFDFQFTTAGGTGPYTYTIEPVFTNVPALPPGLNLSASGQLSGTPTSSGTYNFAITVHDSAGHTFMRTLGFQVADFINGGGSGGLLVSTPNPFDVSIGVWTDVFLQLARFASVNLGATWSVVGGSLPPGVTLIGNTLSGRPSTAGTYVFRVRGNDAGNPTQFAERELTLRVSPMQVVAPAVGLTIEGRTSLPPAVVGTPYFFRYRIAGGTPPYTFTKIPSPLFTMPAPAGITFSSSGILSGTATQSGVYTPGFIVSDSAGHEFLVQGLEWTVTPAGVATPLMVDDEVDADSPVPMGVDFGTSFLARLDTLVRSGVAPYHWSVAPGSNLPPGGALVSGGGLVSDIIAGRATTPGTYSFTLNVEDGAGQMGSVTFNNVRVTTLSVAPLRLPTGVVGAPYNAALTLSGGTPPYGPMQLLPGSNLPPGLTLSAGGLLSGTATAPGNFLLAPMYSDMVSMEYVIYRLTIDSAATAGEAKAVSLSPSAIDVIRPQGSPTAPIPLTINITSGHPVFTAVITGIPGATISANTGTTPAVLSVDLNTQTLAPGVYHGMVGVKVAGAANIDEITPIIVTIGPPPVVQAISVTPNTGTGVRQIFTATYSDSVGVASDLKRAMLRIGASTVNGCVVDYNAITATVRLFDDTGVAGAPAVLGSGGTLSNSQCTLNLATSSAALSLAGPTVTLNTLTLALDISFAAAFAGPQGLAVRAMSNAGPNTGFINKGTFTVGLPPPGVQAISITPNSGNGPTQTFVLAYSDSAGVIADLKVARVRFIPAGGGAMCMIDYNAMTNLVRMMGNDGITWSPFVPFGAGSLANGQCGLNLVTSSALRVGTDLTLTLALVFNPAFAGAKNIDMRANSNFGPTTGWVNRGTWTVP